MSQMTIREAYDLERCKLPNPASNPVAKSSRGRIWLDLKIWPDTKSFIDIASVTLCFRKSCVILFLITW